MISIFNLICLIVRGLRDHIHRNDPLTEAEIDALLTDLASKNPERLDWQNSIVDLMKLLNLDSSLKSRKALALELEYPGDANTGSGAMNVWLATEVRKRIASHNVDSLRDWNA